MIMNQNVSVDDFNINLSTDIFSSKEETKSGISIFRSGKYYDYKTVIDTVNSLKDKVSESDIRNVTFGIRKKDKAFLIIGCVVI